jgi:hypothetical protein
MQNELRRISTFLLSVTFVLLSTGCSTVGSNDKQVCQQLTVVFAPMNDGSDPDIAKWEKAWPQVEQLAQEASDSDLKVSLSTLSVAMHTFATTVRVEGKAPLQVGPLDVRFQTVLSACEQVLTK